VSFLLVNLKIKFRRIVTPSLVFVLALFALILASVKTMVEMTFTEGSYLKIGVCYDFDDPIAESFAENLRVYTNRVAEVEVYSGEEELRADVLGRKLDFGYGVGDFGGSYDGILTVYHREDDLLTPNVTNVTAASLIIQTMAPKLGYGVLKKHYPDISGEMIRDEIGRRTADYLEQGKFMGIDYGGIYGLENMNNDTRPLYHGIVSLFSVFVALLAAASLINGRDAWTGRIMKARGVARFVYYLSDFFTVFAVLGLIHTVLGAACYVWDKSILYPPAAEIAGSFALISVLSGIVLFLTATVKPGAMPALIIFTTVSGALFSDVVLRLDEIMKGISFLKYFFPSYYYTEFLRSGGWLNYVILIGSGAVTAGASFAAVFFVTKRSRMFAS